MVWIIYIHSLTTEVRFAPLIRLNAHVSWLDCRLKLISSSFLFLNLSIYSCIVSVPWIHSWEKDWNAAPSPLLEFSRYWRRSCTPVSFCRFCILNTRSTFVLKSCGNEYKSVRACFLGSRGVIKLHTSTSLLKIKMKYYRTI